VVRQNSIRVENDAILIRPSVKPAMASRWLRRNASRYVTIVEEKGIS
jgi:hypothetical protein